MFLRVSQTFCFKPPSIHALFPVWPSTSSHQFCKEFPQMIPHPPNPTFHQQIRKPGREINQGNGNSLHPISRHKFGGKGKIILVIQMKLGKWEKEKCHPSWVSVCGPALRRKIRGLNKKCDARAAASQGICVCKMNGVGGGGGAC